MLIELGHEVDYLNNFVTFMFLVSELALHSDNVLNFALVKLNQSCLACQLVSQSWNVIEQVLELSKVNLTLLNSEDLANWQPK